MEALKNKQEERKKLDKYETPNQNQEQNEIL